MAFSDVIALIALLVSFTGLGVTFWFNRRQLALIQAQEKRLTAKVEAEALETRKADIGAKLIKLGSSKYRVRIFNKRPAAAQNVELEFPDGNKMIVESELRDKFPMEVLEQHQSVELVAAVHNQTPRKQTVVLRWADDYSPSNEKTSYLTF